MKKTCILITMIVAMIASSTISNAQHGRFALGLDLGIPMGKFRTGDNDASGSALYAGNGIGIGINFRYEHPIGDHIGLTGTTGYLIFFGLSTTSTDMYGNSNATSASIVGIAPFQVGMKYYFTENQKGFYVMGNLGIHFTAAASASDNTNDNINGSSEDISRTTTGLSYAPEVGYCLEHFDFALRYQFFSYPIVQLNSSATAYESGTSTQSYIALHAAYVFGRIK